MSSRLSRWQSLALYCALSLGAVGMLMPLVWMAATAAKDMSQAFRYPPELISQPLHLTDNLNELLRILPFLQQFANSLFVTIAITLGQLWTCSFGAYAFARLRFRGRDALFLLYVATMMVPNQVTLIPLFLIMRTLGWLDHYPSLIVPFIFSAYGTFLLRQFFLTIPRELEEAARLDGAGFFTIYGRIILPLSGPALATLGSFTFIWAWNEFLWPLVAINSPERMTLTVGLSTLQGLYNTQWQLLMAGALVAVIPSLVVFLALQRFFVAGIATTGLRR